VSAAHELATGTPDRGTSNERERIKALERENKPLRGANEILQLASASLIRAQLEGCLKS
jgi:hypothetical protein